MSMGFSVLNTDDMMTKYIFFVLNFTLNKMEEVLKRDCLANQSDHKHFRNYLTRNRPVHAVEAHKKGIGVLR